PPRPWRAGAAGTPRPSACAGPGPPASVPGGAAIGDVPAPAGARGRGGRSWPERGCARGAVLRGQCSRRGDRRRNAERNGRRPRSTGVQSPAPVLRLLRHLGLRNALFGVCALSLLAVLAGGGGRGGRAARPPEAR